MTDTDQLAAIIDGCRQGDEASFSQLVEAYSGRFYGYFYRLTGNRAVSEDLLSDLFMRLVTRIGSYRGGSLEFDGWLFRVASNIFRDFLRGKRLREKLLEGRKKRLEEDSRGRKELPAEQLDRLGTALERLDAETRELVVLRYYSQMSFKELAAMRDEPIGTTLSKVHRAIKRLRELMEQDS